MNSEDEIKKLNKEVKKIKEKMESLDNQVRHLKNLELRKDPKRAVDFISQSINKSEIRAEILLYCFDKKRLQKEIGDYLGIDRRNIYNYLEHLLRFDMLEVLGVEKRSRIFRTTIHDKNLLKTAIKESLDPKIAKKLLDKY